MAPRLIARCCAIHLGGACVHADAVWMPKALTLQMLLHLQPSFAAGGGASFGGGFGVRPRLPLHAHAAPRRGATCPAGTG